MSPPSKLDKLRFAGYSAEFLDRVTEPNGNIPDKYSLGESMILISGYQTRESASSSKFHHLALLALLALLVVVVLH